ncbi:MAG: LysR family transcriptional regulator [Burkholderiales bacterium RIFCSPLOWO2_12_FULL_61_40]|nr:MAG: LysR family transcriptional regulator [Burkholderiales bacterium RIFCSPLOWO2_12_FULL_61_40]
MDRFDAMRAYVQVVESGSYTKAAQQLNMHKATVSQQIQQLEGKINARLLIRTTRSVTPTAEGLTYYQHACSILKQVDDVEAQMRQGSHAPAGHLRVNVPVAMGRQIFAPEIRGFLKRYPQITIELACSDRSVDLIQEGVDCALRGGLLPDSSLSAYPVGNLRFALCAAPLYIEEYGLAQSPQELTRHQQIGFLLASTGKMRPIQLTKAGQTLEVDVPARFVTTDSAAALSAGLDGLGIVHLAEFVASHYLASGALVRVLPHWQCPSLPLHLVTPTNQRRAARVKAFMEWAQLLLRQRLGTQLELR